MKIIKDVVQADFKDLVIGTVFEYNSQFFMKTENLLHGIEFVRRKRRATG